MSDDVSPSENPGSAPTAGGADPAEVVSAMAQASTKQRVIKSRGVLGGFMGFFLGLFLALDMLLLHMVNTSSVLLLILPVGFLVLGIVLGKTTPLRRA